MELLEGIVGFAIVQAAFDLTFSKALFSNILDLTINNQIYRWGR